MSRFVRPSKYRHVYGTAAKKEGCFDNVKVSMNAWDTNLVSTNGVFLALNWNASGGGAFAVLPLDRPGKLPDVYPLARGHTATVLDTEWSPFHDDIVVSGSDDGTLGIWRIDPSFFAMLDLSEKDREKAGGMPDLTPLARINTGTRRVGQVIFHPTAENIVAASTGDHQVRLYDISSVINSKAGDGKTLLELSPAVSMTGPKDSIQSMAFDYAGDRIAVTSRDKQMRIYDTRKGGEPIAQCPGHEGVKGARVIWCGNSERIITTGFTRTSDRQLFLWDAVNLTKPIKALTLDTSSGVVMPFWSDNQVIFLAGKGDGNTRYYELENDEIYELAEYKSTEPQRGITFASRRRVNASENEIARAYKVTGNMIQPISFQVPRRAETFQADIFPPAASSVPALSADDFLQGKRAPPNLVSLEDGSSVIGGAPLAPAAPAAAPAPAKVSTPTAEPVPAPAPEPSRASSLPEPKRAVPSAAVEIPSPSVVSRPASPVKTGPENGVSLGSTQKAMPATNGGAVRSAAAAPAGDGKAQQPSGDMQSLRDEVDMLKEEMAKRDTLIRKLEVENERLRANARRVRDAVGAV